MNKTSVHNHFFANLARKAHAAGLGSGTMTTTDPNIVGVERVPRVARCVAGKLWKSFDFGRPSRPLSVLFKVPGAPQTLNTIQTITETGSGGTK